MDQDVTIVDYNQAARALLAQDPPLVLRRRAGEVLHCLRAGATPEGCGRSAHCPDCVVRGSVKRCFAAGTITRQKARLELVSGGEATPAYFLVTAAPFVYQGQPLALLILEDIGELVELRGLLPICARCKKVRDQAEVWQSVEHYLSKRLDIDFTHGMCPECLAELYPQYADKPETH